MLSTQLRMARENFDFKDSTEDIKELEVILEDHPQFLNDLYAKTSYGEVTIDTLDEVVEDILNELDEESIIECVVCDKKISWEFKVCEECYFNILKEESEE